MNGNIAQLFTIRLVVGIQRLTFIYRWRISIVADSMKFPIGSKKPICLQVHLHTIVVNLLQIVGFPEPFGIRKPLNPVGDVRVKGTGITFQRKMFHWNIELHTTVISKSLFRLEVRIATRLIV